MPRGTFIPLRNPVRFFARIHSATLECPFCGRVLMLGKGQRDAAAFNKVTSTVKCTDVGRRDTVGCGRKFLIGVIAWPLRVGGRQPIAQTPPDQIPEPHQLAEIRAAAAGRFARDKKLPGEDSNHLENFDDPAEPYDAGDSNPEED